MEVLTARSAEEASEILKEMHPDAIISDIGMPGKNGYEFIRSVRTGPNDNSKIPAMALTAFASKQAEEKALEAGFEMYVPKPIESKKLVNALKILIKEQSA